jgi:catechol 2,3-dioxygenase-like lactoylglutathione lyase family enzyme
VIKGIDHVTINVKDKKKSLEFYEKFLGLKRVGESVILGGIDHYYFYLTGECRLELLCYLDEQQPVTVPQKGLGSIRHFALLTDDVDAVWRRCVEAGVPVRMEPTDLEQLNCRALLVEDPNGVEIEFVKRPLK